MGILNTQVWRLPVVDHHPRDDNRRVYQRVAVRFFDCHPAGICVRSGVADA